MSGVVAIVSLSPTGEIRGFGMMRPCYEKESYRLGPLYADNPDTAIRLTEELFARVGVNKTFFLDAPESNPFVIKLAEALGLKRLSDSDTDYMLKGKAPRNMNNNSVYSVNSLELG